MKKLLKTIALFSAVCIVFSLFGCAEQKTVLKREEYENWFVNGFEPAYKSYIESGKAENAPSSDLSLLIASDDYVKMVFAFIKDGTKPAAGEITEKDGVYTYAYGTFRQEITLNEEKAAMKIVMHQSDVSDDRVEFIAVFAQQGSHYYLQYLSPEFKDYAEVRFTAKSGKAIRRDDLSALPYDIYSSDIPSGFAKEK